MLEPSQAPVAIFIIVTIAALAQGTFLGIFFAGLRLQLTEFDSVFESEVLL